MKTETNKTETEKEEPVVRPLKGAQVSWDGGRTWQLRALCGECLRTDIECRIVGETGALFCDWCGAENEMYAKKKRRKNRKVKEETIGKTDE